MRLPAGFPLEHYIPVPESGCWLWLGAWNENRYGVVRASGRTIGTAHRVFYAAHKGPIPPGMFVCHKCDTPACVNPDHLFVGTTHDNNADRKAKGRYLGTWNGRARLSEADVVAIRESQDRPALLALRYGVSTGCIYNILARRTWGHTGDIAA